MFMRNMAKICSENISLCNRNVLPIDCTDLQAGMDFGKSHRGQVCVQRSGSITLFSVAVKQLPRIY